jgi:hypothetical protein
MPARPVEVGQRFGRGVVLVPDAGRSNKSGNVVVTMQCDCSNEYTAARADLWTGRVQSCGCLRAELLATGLHGRGEAHPLWKGAAASYSTLHARLRRLLGSATHCSVWDCGASYFEWANLTGDYGDPDDYVQMCGRCHRRFDAAVKLMQTPTATYWRSWRGA